MISALILQVSTHSDEPGISVQTAVLILVTAALLFVVKEVVGMRRRIASLEEQLAQTAATPAASAQPSPAASIPTPLAPATAPVSLPSDVVAAISAAIHLTYGSRSRIVAIAAPPPEHVQAWSTEGRRQVFQSHKIR